MKVSKVRVYKIAEELEGFYGGIYGLASEIGEEAKNLDNYEDSLSDLSEDLKMEVEAVDIMDAPAPLTADELRVHIARIQEVYDNYKNKTKRTHELLDLVQAKMVDLSSIIKKLEKVANGGKK